MRTTIFFFLTALAIPFTFARWKPVLLLATIFTLTHCLALGLSVYDLFGHGCWPSRISDTGDHSFDRTFQHHLPKIPEGKKSVLLHVIATAFFGLIHGFGFSNYFKMLMAGEEEKLMPLLGFATGIEISQLTIVLFVLAIAYVIQSIFKVKQPLFVVVASILVILLTIPVLIDTFPNSI